MQVRGFDGAGELALEPTPEVNTTPLIDVMLVLLVMLIITIPIQLHSVNLNLNTGHSAPPVTPPDVHQVSIDFDGHLYWDGQALSGAAALDAKLHAIGHARAVDQAEVVIKPDKWVDYGAGAAVMASAQRHGVVKLGMVGRDPASP